MHTYRIFTAVFQPISYKRMFFHVKVIDKFVISSIITYFLENQPTNNFQNYQNASTDPIMFR